MNRRIIKLCAFILGLASGGAILNVAVAWGYAGWSDETWGGAASPNESDLAWGWRIGLQAEQVHSIAFMGNPGLSNKMLYKNLTSRELSFYLEPLPHAAAVSLAAGLPLHSLTGEFWLLGTDSLDPKSQWTGSGGVVVKGLRESKFIPLIPIWPGFAINTLFYAAMLWLLLAGPGRLRRFVRLRRGLCPACAYPIGTNPRCTECGRPVTVRQ